MKDNINILVVEDDADINNLLHKILSKQGYNVRSAYSGSEAKFCLEQQEYHLVLLDLMIPGITGEELISDIRNVKTIPILVISAKPGQDIKVEVLRLGADDFISKPFDIEEVVARVESQLRRYLIFSNGDNNSNIFKHKNLVLNTETFEVEVKGQAIAVTAREFKLLKIMMSHPNKVFTKANLFESVWDSEYLGDDNTVNVHMSNLRSKLAKADPDTEYIHTVWGIGFKMNDKT
ncbi:response regulator transcription factor [Clostridium sp. D2Q-11]|uniref:Response regulator transcription factor n=1 Tax=Anaeromonas frigoriresistens TaxID=2683708 RepID=A0A942UUD0_9FIRM|nr:response regulator transcription factor [Anaeromonas frigoriresistens]MBS4538753.1 response regulator transcription factor [Anaeromonas frigoriresistens]